MVTVPASAGGLLQFHTCPVRGAPCAHCVTCHQHTWLCCVLFWLSEEPLDPARSGHRSPSALPPASPHVLKALPWSTDRRPRTPSVLPSVKAGLRCGKRLVPDSQGPSQEAWPRQAGSLRPEAPAGPASPASVPRALQALCTVPGPPLRGCRQKAEPWVTMVSVTEPDIHSPACPCPGVGLQEAVGSYLVLTEQCALCE